MPTCERCGSERVVKDDWACWNPESGLWEVENVYDQALCWHCESETTLVWMRKDELQRARIRQINDRFRTQGVGNGPFLLTQGVQSLGDDFVRRTMDAVQAFDNFLEQNDPWGQHDFGAIEIEGQKIFWKLDYYDLTLTWGSPNPANEAVTRRILMIMLASEY